MINVKNNDNKCFAYSIASCLQSDKVKEHCYRPSNYDITEIDKIIIKIGAEYPITINNTILKKVEDKLNISLCIFSYDSDKSRYPVYVTKNIKEKHINLL